MNRQQPAATGWREHFYNAVAVALAILLPAILLMVAWRGAVADAEEDARARFEFRATQLRDQVARRMLDYEQVLRGAAGLMAASAVVQRDEWRSYYEDIRLEQYYPSIQSMGYAPRVNAGGREQFIAAVRADGNPGYQIHPPGERDSYTPVLYIEPFTGRNLRTFGYDMNSERVRRSAMERAVADGRVAVSERVTLLQETEGDRQPGFLMYIPIYRKGMVIDTLQQRNRAVQGFVFAAVRTGSLINRIAGEEKGIGLVLYDGAAAADSAQLYRTIAEDTHHTPQFTWIATIPLQGHAWTLRLYSTPQFEASVNHETPRMVLLGGAAIHLLLLAVLWSLWSTRSRAIRLASTMTSEVQHREAEWQAMSEASPLGIFRADADGDYVYANPRYEQLFGITAEGAADGGWLAVVHPEDRSRVDGDWKAVVGMQSAKMVCTYRVLRPGGPMIWVTASVALIREDNGITGYVGIVEDVTERRQATEALLKSRERLGMALEGSNLALFDWDIASGEVRLSEQWQLMRGGDKMETVTTIGELQSQVHPDDLSRLQQSLVPVLKGNTRFYEIQHRVRNIHGDWRWILSRAKVSERDESGKALRLVGTNADITSVKEIERLKNEFISTVSHELRTPLTAIIGSLSLIREMGAGFNEDAATFLDMAYQNSERLSALINDVLDLEKIESGQMTLDLQPLQLREVLEKAVHINLPYAEVHRTRLHLLPGPEFNVTADPDRLMQVLTNLISNAAKFSLDDGEVEISAEQRGAVVRVAVRDHGAGIPENFRNLIFQRFERVDNSDSRKKGGTGLGLSISKALVERMNGKIGFESEVGKGSTFYFDLPLADDPNRLTITS
jgi:PAS domain S-box-containing protein